MNVATLAVSQPKPSARRGLTRWVATKSGASATNVSTGEASERTESAHKSADATASMTADRSDRASGA